MTWKNKDPVKVMRDLIALFNRNYHRSTCCAMPLNQETFLGNSLLAIPAR